MIKLPGLIDIHTHLRTPGQEQKEDFYTGTLAALAGGFTTILDMPNNKIPITTLDLLEEKIELAENEIVCDLGFYFGSIGDNLEEFENIKNSVFGLKLYLNPTTGNFLIDEEKLKAIYQSWPSDQPIILHCEGETLPMAMDVIRQTNKKTHIAHVSSQEELSIIIAAKEEGLPITCGVTPHHLFLTTDDEKELGPLGKMKPFLKTRQDVDFLWDHLNSIDIVESDHAPHTLEEKNSDNTPFGVPGLETTLPLLLTAVSEGRITLDEIKRLLFTNPAKIFNIPTDPETFIEVDAEESYEIKNEDLKTKSGWSPFSGWRVQGKIKAVFIRGTKVFEDLPAGRQVLAKKGSGKIISPKIS